MQKTWRRREYLSEMFNIHQSRPVHILTSRVLLVFVYVILVWVRIMEILLGGDGGGKEEAPTYFLRYSHKTT